MIHYAFVFVCPYHRMRFSSTGCSVCQDCTVQTVQDWGAERFDWLIEHFLLGRVLAVYVVEGELFLSREVSPWLAAISKLCLFLHFQVFWVPQYCAFLAGGFNDYHITSIPFFFLNWSYPDDDLDLLLEIDTRKATCWRPCSFSEPKLCIMWMIFIPACFLSTNIDLGQHPWLFQSTCLRSSQRHLPALIPLVLFHHCLSFPL